MSRSPKAPTRNTQVFNKAVVSKSQSEVAALFMQGIALHQQGQLALAKVIYEQVLAKQSTHFNALHLLGVIAAQSKNPTLAVELIGKAIEINPMSAEAYSNRGNALKELNRLGEAVASYDRAIEIKPDYAVAYLNRGNSLQELRQFDAALASYDKAIEIKPDYAEAHSDRGVAFQVLKRFEEAVSSYDRAIEIKPDYAVAHYNRGNSLQELKQFDASLASYDKAIEIKPDYAEAYYNRGNVLKELKQFEKAVASYDKAIDIRLHYADAYYNRGNALQELKQFDAALASYDKAIEIKPDYAVALSNRGITLQELKQFDAALASYDKAIEIKPDYAVAYSNRGITYRALKRFEEAVSSYERAIELKPDCAEAWGNRGAALNDLRRHDEALASYDCAIELKPDYAEAWGNRGAALNDLQRHEEALASYERAIELKPDGDFWLGDLVHTQMKSCDWTDLEQRCRILEERLHGGSKASPPFAILGLFDDPQLQLQCAELYAKDKIDLTSLLGPIDRRTKKNKIRVGYFSMDFREHPVAQLMAELIETHDRDKFEIYGFSFGVNTWTAMRRRLEGAFDKFFEVRPLSELSIARLAREHAIDIAIDLGGYTQDSRPAIFAHRAAPIQINYLGFPGTMGTKHHDYFIGDRVTVPVNHLEHFSEKVMFLPNSFQANPSSRPIGSKETSRASYGLPESGFVFCCFNNVWKVTPNVFKLWASILQKVKGSVLWLSIDSDKVRLRLKSALESLDVDADRLLFSPRVTRELYFDQYKFSDLFLDTLPYNAGTTASDALWMGTPLVTLAGESFSGRMAGSLLHAVGLPELITHTTEQYESLAIELANNPEKITSLKARLAENRATYPLFNTALFTRHIESAYQAAYERYHEGLATDHIYVSS